MIAEAITTIPVIHKFIQRHRAGCRRHYDRAKFMKEAREMIREICRRN